MLRHAIGKVEAKTEAEILELHDDIAGIPFNVPPARAPVIDVDQDDDGMVALIDWSEVQASRTTTSSTR